jgi:hypothetical protein
MPMSSDQIKTDCCYLVRADDGREIIAKIVKIIDRKLTLLNEKGGPLATMRFNTARFHWRRTEKGSPWSDSHQQLSIADFALRAEKEVACD